MVRPYAVGKANLFAQATSEHVGMSLDLFSQRFVKANDVIVDATVKSVIERTDGLHLQVDYGHDQTALVSEWQVVR